MKMLSPEQKQRLHCKIFKTVNYEVDLSVAHLIDLLGSLFIYYLISFRTVNNSEQKIKI